MSLKSETKKGVIWSSVERFSVQGIQFLVMLIMARLLSPHDYGVVGMIAVFTSVAQVFVDSGFSQALIRKNNRTEVDNSTVFYFNLVVSIFIYIILYLSAPLIAHFYNMPMLVSYIRVVGIVIIINSLSIVQVALYSSSIDFKTQAKASLFSVIISGIIGIFLAFNDYGPWALVAQQISNSVINTSVLWIYSSWRPLWAYSWKSFRELFQFGSKLLATGIINAIYGNIHTIVIGKLYSAQALGLYSRANHFASFPSSNFTTIFQRVTYPVLCKVQDDLERLATVYRKMLRCSVFIVFPCMMLLAAMAKPIVLITVGEKWVECAYLLTIICFGRMWYPVHAINLDILQVSGRSDLFLKLEIYKKLISLIILVISAPLGIAAMCYGNIIASLICLYINTYYSSRILGITLWSQIKDFMPTLMLSLFLFMGILAVNFFVSLPIMQIMIDLLLGCLIYIGGSILMRYPEYEYIKEIVKNK